MDNGYIFSNLFICIHFCCLFIAFAQVEFFVVSDLQFSL